MDLYPAIDLRGRRVVQLVGGDFDVETVHADDPVEVARRFEAAGAPWIHVVDLDAARTAEPVNRDLIGAVAAAVSVPVQASGGVRTEADAAALADAGVARVVMGTALIEAPEVLARVAARQSVAAGLDVRGDEVAVRGWVEGSGVGWRDALARLEGTGVAAVVVTQILVEGRLAGPDLAGLGDVLEATTVEVIASGGVGTLDHLRALAALRAAGRGLSGAIVGTALYEGRVDPAEAVAALGGRR